MIHFRLHFEAQNRSISILFGAGKQNHFRVEKEIHFRLENHFRAGKENLFRAENEIWAGKEIDFSMPGPEKKLKFRPNFIQNRPKRGQNRPKIDDFEPKTAQNR